MSTEDINKTSARAESLNPEPNYESAPLATQKEPSGISVGPTKEERTQELEADKLFLDKWDQLSTQALYVCVGVFAVLPTVLGALRSPYKLYLAVWIIVAAGIVGVSTLGLTKVINNGYYRRLSKWMKGEYSTVDVQAWSYLIFQLSLFSVAVQVIAFIVFIAVNIPHSFQEAPKIEGIQANQLVVQPGDTVTIQVNAKDRDNDRLFYKWTTTEGKIVDDDEPSITWIAPNSASADQHTYNIEVIVSDGQNNTTGATSIIVRESPEIKAGIQRLCFKATPLDTPIDTSNKPVSLNSDQSSQFSFPLTKANFQTDSPNASSSVPFKFGVACDRIKEFVNAGESPQERKTRIDIADKEIDNRIELKKKSPKQKWLPCCSTALVPFLCDPRC